MSTKKILYFAASMFFLSLEAQGVVTPTEPLGQESEEMTEGLKQRCAVYLWRFIEPTLEANNEHQLLALVRDAAFDPQIVLMALTALEDPENLHQELAKAFYALFMETYGRLNTVVNLDILSPDDWKRIMDAWFSGNRNADCTLKGGKDYGTDCSLGDHLRPYHARLLQALHERMPEGDKVSFWDLGGASGYTGHLMASTLANCRATTVDLDQTLYRQHVQTLDLASSSEHHFVKSDILDFLGTAHKAGQRANVINISHTLKFLSEEQRQEVLSLAFKCLRPGGKLFVLADSVYQSPIYALVHRHSPNIKHFLRSGHKKETNGPYVLCLEEQKAYEVPRFYQYKNCPGCGGLDVARPKYDGTFFIADYFRKLFESVEGLPQDFTEIYYIGTHNSRDYPALPMAEFVTDGKVAYTILATATKPEGSQKKKKKKKKKKKGAAAPGSAEGTAAIAAAAPVDGAPFKVDRSSDEEEEA